MSDFLAELLDEARVQAAQAGHKTVRTEYLLLALLRLAPQPDYPDADQFAARLQALPCPVCAAPVTLHLSTAAARALDQAARMAAPDPVQPQHLLSALQAASPLCRRLLAQHA